MSEFEKPLGLPRKAAGVLTRFIGPIETPSLSNLVKGNAGPSDIARKDGSKAWQAWAAQPSEAKGMNQSLLPPPPHKRAKRGTLQIPDPIPGPCQCVAVHATRNRKCSYDFSVNCSIAQCYGHCAMQPPARYNAPHSPNPVNDGLLSISSRVLPACHPRPRPSGPSP